MLEASSRSEFAVSKMVAGFLVIEVKNVERL